MPKIRRTECPRALRGKKKAKAAYRKKKIVKHLWAMQHEKCCYCEAKIPEEGQGKAVDHFRPKSIFKSRVNDWNNLLLACSHCNGRKSDRFPIELTDEQEEPKVLYIRPPSRSATLLIDPSDGVTDPEQHIDYVVKLGRLCGTPTARRKSRRGRMTIDIVGLESNFHRGRRAQLIRRMTQRFCDMLEAMDQRDWDSVGRHKDWFTSRAKDNAEYAATARAFVRKHKLDREFQMVVWNS